MTDPRRWLASRHAGAAIARRRQVPFELILLAAWIASLLLIPAPLVVSAIGAPGRPAGLLGLALLLWWTLTTVSRRNDIGVRELSRILIALFLVVVIASYVSGNLHGWYAPLSVRQETDDYYSLLAPDVATITATMVSAADRGILAALAWVGVMLVASESVRRWDDLRALVSWIVGLGAVVAGIAVVEFVTGQPLASRISVPGLSVNGDLGGVLSRSVLNRVSSTAIHPIELGVVLACLFPLALHQMLFRRRAGDVVVAAVLGLAALLTISRSAIVCLVVAMAVLWVTWPGRWKRRSLLLLPLIAIGVRSAVPGLLGTIRALFRDAGGDPSVTGRTSDYGVVLDLYVHHASLGRGLFTFVPANYRVLDNQFLMVLIELGAVGAGAVLLLLLTALMVARSASRRAPEAEQRHLARSLMSALAAWCVALATFDAWSFPMAAGIGFLLIGLAFTSGRLSRSAVSPRGEDHTREAHCTGLASAPA